MPENNVSEKEREIIIARLEVTSPDLRFAEGNNLDAYSRDEMIQLIKQGDPTGIEFVRTEWEFMRATKSGDLIKAVS